MIPPSMTLSEFWPRFQGYGIFSTLNILEKTWDGAIVTIERQSEIVCALSSGDISNILDGSLTRFSRSRHLWSRITQKQCVWGKIYQRTLIGNTIHNLSNGATSNDLEWPLTRFHGHDIFEVEYRILKTKLLLHKRKLYLTCGIVLWWPWLTYKRVAQVCQHQPNFLLSSAIMSLVFLGKR